MAKPGSCCIDTLNLGPIIFNDFVSVLSFFLKSGLEIEVFSCATTDVLVNARRSAHIHG